MEEKKEHANETSNVPVSMLARAINSISFLRGKLKEREDSTSSSSSAQSKFYYTGRSVNQDNSNAETTGYSSLVVSQWKPFDDRYSQILATDSPVSNP
ncbi:hypothetical protein EB796_009166 [Bugula neritina]|uniref:Uncharacterized protein n=1 Tax=Bugula neritina TaxID=10212 RepID=A0A7J7K302_BUGNE|nr:hypothetical protein EB796_009166 [Bugula neritina]